MAIMVGVCPSSSWCVLTVNSQGRVWHHDGLCLQLPVHHRKEPSKHLWPDPRGAISTSACSVCHSNVHVPGVPAVPSHEGTRLQHVKGLQGSTALEEHRSKKIAGKLLSERMLTRCLIVAGTARPVPSNQGSGARGCGRKLPRQESDRLTRLPLGNVGFLSTVHSSFYEKKATKCRDIHINGESSSAALWK